MSSCNQHLTYQEKELEILRQAVDKAQAKQGKRTAQSDEVLKIIKIVETFLIRKKLVCYGGTAINNILPTDDQFYDKSIEIPDYDFFSPNAMKDAKELADIYYKEGYDEVEAKAGQHYGTYKVFVNFIPVADITSLDEKLYKTIHKLSIHVGGIYYAPANFLRMAMYLELSRPDGDVGRWEKVLKRLTLLNKNYPLKGHDCDDEQVQRGIDDENTDESLIYKAVKQSFIDQGVIFFGGFANSLYSRYMSKKARKQMSNIPDFDVLAEDPETAITIVKERLADEGLKKIKIIKKPGIGEIIAPHYELRVGRDTIAFIYQPLACHSYNTIKIGRSIIRVATIDTMLSFYLAFLYANRPYYSTNRVLCMAQHLFKVQSKNRLQQKGLLRRFSISCYGKQDTQEHMRAEKTIKYNELKNKRGTKEFDEWFLRYVPQEKNKKNNKTKRKKTKKRKKRKTQKRKINKFIEF